MTATEDPMTTRRIHAERLIPGRGEPITNGVVVVDGRLITYAGPAAEAPNTGDGPVQEADTILPGLWECHGHYTGMSSADLEVDAKEPLALKAARATRDLRETLRGGVTSVREVGGLGLQLRPAVEERAVTGPHLYAAGQILSTTGGHADVHGLPLDWVHSANQAGTTIGALCDGVPEVLKAVRRQLRGGADVIKVCASGGVMSEIDHPMHQQFSDEELHAIVAEAGRAERAVAAHCHGKAGIMAALRAGVTTIEHGSFLDEEAAAAMKQAGAILVPTRFIIAELLEMEDALPAYAYRKGVLVADHHEQALKIAVAAGVTIATGTDVFISGTEYGMTGAEVRHLIEAGMTPLQAVEAATANGPLTLGPQAPQSGQLREGYAADIIAMDGNPLDDLSIWGDKSRITHVWKAGEPHHVPEGTLVEI
jgi:imidazolonepropionase-like amidohydrolase